MDNQIFDNEENFAGVAGGVCSEPANPESIRNVLERLKGRRVTIMIKGCCFETVQVLEVRGEVAIFRTARGGIKFVRLECICEVITCCPDLFL